MPKKLTLAIIDLIQEKTEKTFKVKRTSLIFNLYNWPRRASSGSYLYKSALLNKLNLYACNVEHSTKTN